MLTWVEVDLRAIKNNIRQIRKYIGPETGLAAVIKSNAYGHGLVEVAKAAFEAGAEFLCVDNIDEAKDAKKAARTSKILILGGVEREDLAWIIKNNIRFGIYDLALAKNVEEVAEKIKKKALAHIKIDTGMHRLGFDYNEAVDSITKIKNNYKNIIIEGLWSHFADSGNRENRRYTDGQIKKFKNIVNILKKEGIEIKYHHLCNSAGTITLPRAHYNLVRSGIIIYGIFPSLALKNKFAKKLALKPAMAFKTKIISLRDLEKGERVGYGLTHRLKKRSKIAVLAVGYKDNYGRNLSNRGEVLIGGIKCPVVGRICMRMTMVDVSKVKGVKLGMEAVLLGGDGRVRIEAGELAEKMGTIPYEVMARISESVPRVYKN